MPTLTFATDKGEKEGTRCFCFGRDNPLPPERASMGLNTRHHVLGIDVLGRRAPRDRSCAPRTLLGTYPLLGTQAETQWG